MATTTPALGLERPTRMRYGVLAFACVLSMITYLDRVCMGSAAGKFVGELGLGGVEDLRWAFTAFAFAYAVFEVPSGWLGDAFGPRKTLIRIVLWWSLFTAATGLIGMRIGSVVIGGVGLLIVVRFLFGMGEAGAYPNITRALHNWFPFQARGFTQGMVWMSGRLMGGLTPLIWLMLVDGTESWKPLMYWRTAFWVFGGLGLIWCALFALRFANRPRENPKANAAERELIEAGSTESHEDHLHVPWHKLLTSGNLWILCLMYFCAAYGWYFNITYLPKFLEEQYSVKPTDWLGAVYKGGPLWVGAAGCLIGGLLTDWFIRRTGNRRLGRRMFGVLGHTLCATGYLLCPLMKTPLTFFITLSLATFANDLTMGSAWSTCQDIGKRYAAIVAGCMNTIGNLGGAAAGWATGYVLKLAIESRSAALGVPVGELTPADVVAAHLRGYHINFYTFAGVYAVAVVCWLVIDSTKPVVPEESRT